MSVYPNPVGINQEFTVNINQNYDELKGTQLQILGIDGRLLRIIPVTDNIMKIAIPAYSGMVVLKLISNNGNEEVKLIVK